MTPTPTTLTLVGLGPGDPDLLTREAWNLLQQATLVYTPSLEYPALAHLSPAALSPLPPDDPAAAEAILHVHAKSSPSLLCALPGHPIDHPLTSRLSGAAAAGTVSLHLVPGVSLVDAWCLAAGVERQHSGVQVVAAEALTNTATAFPTSDGSPDDLAWAEQQNIGTYTPPVLPYPLEPGRPVLLTSWAWAEIWVPPGEGPPRHAALLQKMQHTLLLRYPPAHPVQIVQLNATGRCERLHTCSVDMLAQDGTAFPFDERTALVLDPLPPAANRRSIEGLAWVTARLLGPQGCPWDRKQTFHSLRRNVLEEAYEVLEALDASDMQTLPDELGDLLLQVTIQSEMARQANHFQLEHVLEHITTKLIRRHPHVFGPTEVSDADEVLHNWEQIKAQELAEKGRQRTSVLDGVPAALPALAATQKLAGKAMRAGFTWETLQEVWDKFREELGELTEACEAYEAHPDQHNNHTHLAHEMGDVLFMLVCIAHWLDLDAEAVLREANTRFRQRFTTMEQLLQDEQRTLKDMPLAEILAFWREAKRQCAT